MDYYVYQFSRPDGTPFYIGMGRGRRSETNNGRNRIVRGIIRRIYESGQDILREKLHENLTREEALSIEMKLIQEIGRICDDTGPLANLSSGGQTGPINPSGTKFHHTQETKDKMSLSRRGKSLSKFHVSRISEGKKGHSDTLGYKHTQEFKDKLSKLATGRKQSEESVIRRAEMLRIRGFLKRWGYRMLTRTEKREKRISEKVHS